MRDYIIATLVIFASLGVLTWQLSVLYDRVDWMSKCQKILAKDDCEHEYERINQ